MFERTLPALIALLGTILGLGVRASQRNRLVSRIRSYTKLADDLAPRNPDSATDLDGLTAEFVRQLTSLERQRSARQFEWASVFALGFLLMPAVIAAYFAWTRPGWWTWPVLIAALLWSVTWTVASWGQFWKEHEAATTPQP